MLYSILLQSICLFHKHFLDVITNLKGRNDLKKTTNSANCYF